MPTSVARKLVEYKKRQDAWKEEIGDQYQDFNLVFAQSNGRPLTNNTLGRQFKRYLAQKGIREVDFYSLRHAGATAKLRATKDIKAVQGDMGHSTPQMLLKVYTAIVEEDRQKNAVALEEGIFARIKNEQQNSKD